MKGKHILIYAKGKNKMQNYIKELEAKLESVCGKYESDCNSCPHKRLCDSYSDGVANNNIQNDFINPTGTNKE